MEIRAQRQNILHQNFDFRCECEACSNDWPTFKKLLVKDMKLMKYAKKVNDELLESINTNGKLVKQFNKCKDILQENFKNYPSMELCIIQKSFATFLLKLASQHNYFL